MPQSTTQLTTLPEVKAWLGIADSVTASDALLTRLITAASAYIESWLNRTIAVATYTDILDGNNGARIMVTNWPILSVTSMTISGTPQVPTVTPYDNGYLIEERSIVFRGPTFSRGLANVVITYTAGYTTVPADLAQACIELIGLRFKDRDRIGAMSLTKSIGGENVTTSFSQKDMSDGIKTLLSNYRRVVPL